MSDGNTNPPFLENALEQCQTHLVMDSRVLGLCVFGSLASGDADEYSDIDLGILVEHVQLDDVLSDSDLIAGVAPLLVRSSTLDNDNCVFALHEFGGRPIKVDYNYFDTTSSPPWFLKNVRILYDPSGELSQFIALPCDERLQSSIPSEYFWVALWSAIRMFRRGELLEACDILNHLRDPVVTQLLSVAYGVPFQNYRRFEQVYPPRIVEWMRRTVARPEPAELKTALCQLVDLYTHAISHSRSTDTQPDAQIINRILRDTGLHSLPLAEFSAL